MLFLYKKEMVRFFYLRMFFTYNLKTEMFHGRRFFYLRVFFCVGWCRVFLSWDVFIGVEWWRFFYLGMFSIDMWSTRCMNT